MQSRIVPILARHAIYYAGGLVYDQDLVGGVPQVLRLYNSLLYQTWWELLQLEIEKNPDLGDFNYAKALALAIEFIAKDRPTANGRGEALDAGRKLLQSLQRLEAGHA